MLNILSTFYECSLKDIDTANQFCSEKLASRLKKVLWEGSKRLFFKKNFINTA